jgi:hypothetical protein
VGEISPQPSLYVVKTSEEPTAVPVSREEIAREDPIKERPKKEKNLAGYHGGGFVVVVTFSIFMLWFIYIIVRGIEIPEIFGVPRIFRK